MAQDVVFRRIGGRIVPIKRRAPLPTPKPPTITKAKEKKFKEALQGSALLASGVAVGALSGKVAAHHTIVSAHMENSARSFGARASAIFEGAKRRAAALRVKKGPQMSFDFVDGAEHVFRKGGKAQAFKNFKNANTASIASKRIFQNRLAYISAGSIVAGALIGTGAKKLYDSMAGKNKRSDVGAAIAASSGAAGALAVHTAYYRKLSGGTILSAFRKAAKALKIGL